MKKTISLLLALVMCLSLCACGSGEQSSGTEAQNNATEEQNNATGGQTNASEAQPVEDPEKTQRYEYALSLLNKELHQKQGNEFKEAYEVLTELGDYKNAKAYLERFTIIPNALLSCATGNVNAFNETKITDTVFYLYDSKGRVIGEPCADEISGRVDFSQYQINTYDNAGRLIEQKLIHGGFFSYNGLYKYNDAGLLIEIKYITVRDGTTFLVQTREYNDAGQMIKRESMTSDYQKNVHEFVYENGLLIKVHKWYGYASSYPTDGTTIEITYEYKNGLLDRVCERYDNGYTYLYEYENGLLMRVVCNDENIVSNIYENGRIVREQGNDYFVEYIYGDYYCYTPAE